METTGSLPRTYPRARAAKACPVQTWLFDKLIWKSGGAALTPPHPEEAPLARLRASSTRYGAVSKDAGGPTWAYPISVHPRSAT